MIVFYEHGGSGNHGCEAIVRSSINMLNQPVELFSFNADQDIKYGLDKICKLYQCTNAPLVRGSKKWFIALVQTKMTGKIDKQIEYTRKDFFQRIREGDIYFSVGGDNYCYPGTDILAAERKIIQRKGAKVVLWGCSVEPELLKNSKIARDIASYDLIIARESISYEALRGINRNTYLIPDPAFTLDKIDLPLPKGWKENNMIGINASPLILSSASEKNIVLEAYYQLIRIILKSTDSNIVLVPHVVCKNNDDLVVLKRIFDKFKDTGRLIILNDFNCMQLKGFISKCRMFIGARTHATIAAYSSCVPTLVLGYSVKSKGIAKDIFGTEKNYVISVQNMKNSNDLADKFLWLLKNENRVRTYLQEIIPEYVKKAYDAERLIKRL